MKGDKLGLGPEALGRLVIRLEIVVVALAGVSLGLMLASFFVKSAALVWIAFSLALLALLTVLALTFALYFPHPRDVTRPTLVVLGALSLALIGMNLARISGIEQSQTFQEIFSQQPPVSPHPRSEAEAPSPSSSSPVSEFVKSRLSGAVSHNDRPIKFVTNVVPEFNVKRRESGHACAGLGGRWVSSPVRYTKETGEYELELVPGDYCLWVTVDAALPLGPQATFPGDFASLSGWGIEVSLRSGESRRVDIDVTRFLHILKPVDNDGPLALPNYSGELPRYKTPISVEWETVPDSTYYVVTVLAASRFGFIDDYRSVLSRRVNDTKTDIIDLPATSPGEMYFLTVSAYSRNGRPVGRSSFNDVHGRGWSGGLFEVVPIVRTAMRPK